MKKHTKNFKKEISTFGRQLDNKIAVLGTELVLEKEDLYSITPITNADLLKSVMREVNFESKQQLSIGQEINVKSGVLVNGEYEYIDFGNYFVYKNEYKAETNTYSHVCYDKMLNTMIDYVPLDITYPISLREYIGAIATKCGLEFANKNGTFANYDTLINEDHFSNGNYTFRDVLDYVAQLVGGWLCINDEGKLEVKYPELARNYDSVSGENINFTTNDSDKISKIVVDGKSTQETRSGKNLFDSEFRQGSNTSATVSNYIFSKNIINCEKKNTYIFSTNLDTTVYKYAIQTNTQEFPTYNAVSDNTGWQTTSTTKIETSIDGYLGILITKISGTDITPDEIKNVKFQIEKGSVATSYEPYGVMPSPNYPSEVECVKGKNLLPNNTISQTLNGITFTVNSDKTITANGTSTAVVDLYMAGSSTEYVDLGLSTGSYTLKGCPAGGSAASYVLYAVQKRGDKLSYYQEIGNGLTINVEAGDTFRIFIRILSGKTVSNILYKPMLSKNGGNYMPYNNIQIKDVGKNLFNKDNATILNAFVNYNTGLLNALTNNQKSIAIKIQPNTTYTISGVERISGSNFGIYTDETLVIGSSIATIHSSITNGKLTFTTGANSKWFVFLLKGGAETYGYSNVQLEKNSTATSYEPYQENVSNIDLQGNELCSNGNVKDELFVENGKAKIIKKIGKVVLDGSENWVLNEKGADYTRYALNITDLVSVETQNNKIYAISNCFIGSTGNETVNPLSDANRICVVSNKRLLIKTIDNNLFSLNNFKTWLSTHNTIVYYQLAQEQEIDLGEVEPLNTFEGVNNVSLIANMDTNMQLTYTTDFEEFDKHFLKDVNVSFTKKYGAINSVVFSRGGGSDNIYRKDNASISKNGLTEIKINDNPFLEGDDRENFMQAVFDKLNGLEFYLLDVASTGIMYMELGDLYYFNMVEEKPSLKSGLVKSGMRKAQGSSGGKYICLLTNDEIKITQGLEESIYTDEPVRTETDYKTSAPTDNSIKNAIIQTNKNSAEILLKVNNDEVVSAINLSPEKIKISSAKLDIDAIATFTNSKLAEAGSTVINGANITTGSISCDRLNGGTINGQAIRGGSISIAKGEYYFTMGIDTDNPSVSGLNVGNYGVKAYSDITATGFAITNSDIGKSGTFILRHSNGINVVYLTFTGGILTSYSIV